MTTGKLFWNTLWRGGLWGLFGGALFGAGFGAIFANILFFFGMIAQAPFDLRAQDILSAIVAVIFLALIGAVVGALFGVPSGIVVGLGNGLLLGILSRAFFFPLKDVRVYRRTITIVSAVFSTISACICFIAIALFYANRNAANVPALAALFAIPALVSGVCALFISQTIARWYEKTISP